MATDLVLLETGGTDTILLEDGDDLHLESSSGVHGAPFHDATIAYGHDHHRLWNAPYHNAVSLFAPSFRKTALAPYLDPVTLYTPAFTQPKSTIAPYLRVGGKWAPTFTIGDPDAPDAVRIKVGSTFIEDTFSRSFTEQLNDVGNFTFSMLRTDYLASSITFDNEVVFYINGVARFRGIIVDINHTHRAQGEEVEQIVVINGLGMLAALKHRIVYPSRGVGVLPIEDVRTFSWVGADYTTTVTNWSLAKIVNYRSNYAGTGPRPDLWPNINGRWIWGNVPGVHAYGAPVGVNLFRRDITLAEDGIYRFFYAGDDVMRLWIDGAHITWFAGSGKIGEYVDIEMTAGEHVIAAKVANFPEIPGRINPAGFIFAGYRVAASGLLEELVVESNTAWRVMPYPVRAPGFSVGKVIRLLFEAAGLDATWNLDFSDAQDSDGNAWTYQREISLNVGRTYVEAMRELMQVHADIAVAPGTRTIRAWNRGTRGRVRGVTLQQTTNPKTSDFLSLEHEGTATRQTKLLLRYADGHTTVGSGTKEGYIEIGHITDEEAAKEYGLALLENRSAPAFSTSATLHPRSNTTTPYKAFGVGDWINCPNEDGNNESMRVASIVWTEDEDGNWDWQITLRDRRMEIDERQQVALARMADGTLVGGANVSSRKETPASTSRQIAVLRVAEFSFDNVQIETGPWAKRPAEVSGNIIEVVGELTTAGATTTVINVYKTDTLIGTLTFPPMYTEASVAVDIEPAVANVSKLWIDCTVAGVGAKGLDVQVRAI